MRDEHTMMARGGLPCPPSPEFRILEVTHPALGPVIDIDSYISASSPLRMISRRLGASVNRLEARTAGPPVLNFRSHHHNQIVTVRPTIGTRHTVFAHGAEKTGRLDHAHGGSPADAADLQVGH